MKYKQQKLIKIYSLSYSIKNIYILMIPLKNLKIYSYISQTIEIN